MRTHHEMTMVKPERRMGKLSLPALTEGKHVLVKPSAWGIVLQPSPPKSTTLSSLSPLEFGGYNSSLLVLTVVPTRKLFLPGNFKESSLFTATFESHDASTTQHDWKGLNFPPRLSYLKKPLIERRISRTSIGERFGY